jgi:hypothetical protein
MAKAGVDLAWYQRTADWITSRFDDEAKKSEYEVAVKKCRRSANRQNRRKQLTNFNIHYMKELTYAAKAGDKCYETDSCHKPVKKVRIWKHHCYKKKGEEGEVPGDKKAKKAKKDKRAKKAKKDKKAKKAKKDKKDKKADEPKKDKNADEPKKAESKDAKSRTNSIFPKVTSGEFLRRALDR